MDQQNKINAIKTWLGSGSINIFGIQFSGKDTVGTRLAQALGAEFLGSGDVVRAERQDASNPQLAEAAKDSDTGILTPTDAYREMILPFLSNSKLTGKPLVLGSVGRWIGEEVPVLDALKQSQHDTKAVIVIGISKPEVYKRWEASKSLNDRNVGRADEEIDGVNRRLAEFASKTLPVIDAYRRMDLVIDINGEQSRDEVFAEVIDKLYEFAKR